MASLGFALLMLHALAGTRCAEASSEPRSERDFLMSWQLGSGVGKTLAFGGQQTDVGGWKVVNISYPDELRATRFYDVRCDFSPRNVKNGAFLLNNKDMLRREGFAVDSSWSWVAFATGVVYCGVLMLSFFSLPENPLKDMGSWHVFGADDEAQARKAEIERRMKQVAITREQFFSALPSYKSGLEGLSEQQQDELFDFLSDGENMLSLASISQVRLVPPWCSWAKEWINKSGEKWGRDKEVLHGVTCGSDGQEKVRPVRTLLGSFRSFADHGQRAWFALQVAAGNWEQIASGKAIEDSDDSSSDDFVSATDAGEQCMPMPDGLSDVMRNLVGAPKQTIAAPRIDADWGFETDPARGGRSPKLEDFILQRFDPVQPLHSRMRVRDLLPPCPELQNYEANDNSEKWDCERAYSYMSAALGSPAKVAGMDLYVPWNIQTGLLIFFVQAAVGTVVEFEKASTFMNGDLCTGQRPYNQREFLDEGFCWWKYFFQSDVDAETGIRSNKFFLTFKPELWLLVLYSHSKLLLTSVRLLALAGVNVLTLRSSYGRDWMKVLRSSWFIWLALSPLCLNVANFFLMLPFAPVTLAFVCIWLMTIRPLSRFSHNCLFVCRLPYFTTAPLVTLGIMWFPCKWLTEQNLPDTFLCNWSRFRILGSSESIGDAFREDVTDASIQECMVFWILFGSLLTCVALPVAWCALKSAFAKWLFVRLTYRWWLNQSEPLLCLLHTGPSEGTAKLLARSFVRSCNPPTLPRCIPQCLRERLEDLSLRLDGAFPESRFRTLWRSVSQGGLSRRRSDGSRDERTGLSSSETLRAARFSRHSA